MADRYAGMGDDLMGPASRAEDAVLSDTADLAVASKRLWVGTGGNVKLNTVNGDTVTYNSVPSGTYLNVRAARIWATDTTASNIIVES